MPDKSTINVRITFTGLCAFVPSNNSDPLKGDWDVLLPNAADNEQPPGTEAMLPHAPLLVIPSAATMANAPDSAKTFWDLGRRRIRIVAFDVAGNPLPARLDVDPEFVSNHPKVGWMAEMAAIAPSYRKVDPNCFDTPAADCVAAHFVLDRGSLYRNPFKPLVQEAPEPDADAQWFFPGATPPEVHGQQGDISTPSGARYLTRRVSLEFERIGSLQIVAKELGAANRPAESLVIDRPVNGPWVDIIAGNLCAEDLLAALGRRPRCPDWEMGRPVIDSDFRHYYRLSRRDLDTIALISKSVPTSVVQSGGGLGGCRPKCFCQRMER